MIVKQFTKGYKAEYGYDCLDPYRNLAYGFTLYQNGEVVDSFVRFSIEGLEEELAEIMCEYDLVLINSDLYNHARYVARPEGKAHEAVIHATASDPPSIGDQVKITTHEFDGGREYDMRTVKNIIWRGNPGRHGVISYHCTLMPR